jgi:hypothetical protein
MMSLTYYYDVYDDDAPEEDIAIFVIREINIIRHHKSFSSSSSVEHRKLLQQYEN